MPLIDDTLRYLNDDVDQVYAVTFNNTLQAWRVVRLHKISGTGLDTLYKLDPVGTNHNDLASALRDAMILKEQRSSLEILASLS